MSELDLAQRALSFTRGEAQATVTRERSLFSRFAVSRPTQATRVDDVSVAIFCVHEGHTGSAETNDVSDEGLRAVAAQADAAARSAAAAAPGPGDYPGLAEPAPASAHDGYDAATALLDPAVAGAALQTAFDGCAARGAEAFGLWTAGVVDTAIASSRGHGGGRHVHRRVHEGHRPRPRRAQRLGHRGRQRDRRPRPGGAHRARGGQGHARGAARARARRVPGRARGRRGRHAARLPRRDGVQRPVARRGPRRARRAAGRADRRAGHHAHRRAGLRAHAAAGASTPRASRRSRCP